MHDVWIPLHLLCTHTGGLYMRYYQFREQAEASKLGIQIMMDGIMETHGAEAEAYIQVPLDTNWSSYVAMVQRSCD